MGNINNPFFSAKTSQWLLQAGWTAAKWMYVFATMKLSHHYSAVITLESSLIVISEHSGVSSTFHIAIVDISLNAFPAGVLTLDLCYILANCQIKNCNQLRAAIATSEKTIAEYFLQIAITLVCVLHPLQVKRCFRQFVQLRQMLSGNFLAIPQ